MMLTVVLAALTLTGAPVLSQPSTTVIAAVEQSIGAVRARHAAMPPPADDKERLARLGELDQAPRKVMVAIDFGTVPAAERPAVMAQVSAIMDAVDRENQAALLALLPGDGWFFRSRYGHQAAKAAFHIVHHAELSLQERFLPVLEPLVRTGEVHGQDYGLMFDRIAIQHDRPQRYGSQFRCDGGKWRPYPIEAPEGLDDRRRTLGFPTTFAAMQAYMQNAPPCPQTARPPPPGMKLD